MNDLFYILSAPFILLNINYLFALYSKNFGLIDIAWGLGFVLISLVGVILGGMAFGQEMLVFVLVSLWGLRLSIFLGLRNAGHAEDYRYQDMRKRWGKSANTQAYFKVYLLQFVLMQIVAFPLYIIHFNNRHFLEWYNILGIIVWCLGFIWESVADSQKSKFKNNPKNKNKICNVGLWNLSRHPNYFGETLVWWGIGLASFNGNFLVFIGSLFINFLLLKVSGVPLIEKKHATNPIYLDYMKSTPRLIPQMSKIFKKGRL
jgi:3-oxo-5-alpha-steroid 4-dehydrogenase 1